MEQLSCVIIVDDKLDKLEKCINSANSVSDEIIVVSNIHTCLPAKFGHKVRVVIADTNNQLEQSRLGLSLVANELVLLLNSSEYLSIECQLSLLDIKSTNTFQAYFFPLNYTFDEKTANLTAWKKRYEIRLFNKSKGKVRIAEIGCIWKPFNGSVKNELANGAIISTKLNDLSDCFHFASQYAEFRASKHFKRKKRSNYFKLIIYPIARFLVEYLLKGAIKHGVRGFQLSKIIALSEHIFQRRLMEMQEAQKINSNLEHISEL